MLGILNLEELQGLLIRVPALIELHEQKQPEFAAEVKRWLSELEQVLVHNRMPLAGSIASLRGTLISVQRGNVPNDVGALTRTTQRKKTAATAAEMLRRSCELTRETIQGDITRIAEAERLSRQIIALASFKGLLTDLQTETPDANRLKLILARIRGDPEIAGGVMTLAGTVNANDLLILLDRAIAGTKTG